ncbi:hypothetical protein FRC03_008866 [Tulasnella sp. 419]|nr:hypothetical protein FRC03_008866 [Tulasnella sp. 419]
MLKRTRISSPPPPLPSSYDDEQMTDYDELTGMSGETSTNHRKRRRTIGPNAWEGTSRRMKMKSIIDAENEAAEDDDDEEVQNDSDADDEGTSRNNNSTSAYTSVNTLLHELNLQRLNSMASRNRKEGSYYSDCSMGLPSSESFWTEQKRSASSSTKRVQFAPVPTKDIDSPGPQRSPRAIKSPRRMPPGILINRGTRSAYSAYHTSHDTKDQGVMTLPSSQPTVKLPLGAPVVDPATIEKAVDESEAVKSRYEEMNRLLGVLALSRRRRQPEVDSP